MREGLRFDGGTPPLEKVRFAAVWVAPNGTVWVGGSARVPGEKGAQAGLLGRYEAGRWTFDHDTELRESIEHLWGTGPDDVWAYCSGFFVHWNGRPAPGPARQVDAPLEPAGEVDRPGGVDPGHVSSDRLVREGARRPLPPPLADEFATSAPCPRRHGG
jgi:hypothetical protein